MKRTSAAILAIIALAIAACGGAPPPSSFATSSAAAPTTVSATIGTDSGLTELRIDYATYSPPSLVLKQQGWVEQAFPGVSIKWVYSAGSSNAAGSA